MIHNDFIDMPRNFVPFNNLHHVIEGELKIDNLSWFNVEVTKILLMFWFNCERSSLLRLIVHKENGIKHLKTLDDTKAKFFVKFQDEEFPLLGCTKEKCAILMRVFVPGEARSGKEGWVEFGNSIITDNGVCEIYNPFLKIEDPSCNIVIGKMTCTLNEKRYFEEQVVNFSVLLEEERLAWHSHDFTILNPELTRVLEPVIGYHKWIIPRSCFYLPNKRESKFDEDWLECNLLFSFYLHHINPDTIGDKKDLKKWNRDMTAIVEAFTYFVTRMDYQPDIYNLEGLKDMELEIFSKQVFTVGCGDCEDVAYTMMEIFLHLRNASNFKSELLNKVSAMLRYYIPVNTVVQANAPEMSSSKAKLCKGRTDFDPKDLREAQYRMNHFHVVGMLLSTAFVCNSLVIEGDPEKLYKKMTGSNDYDFGNKLSRFYFEGTVSVHADPDEFIICEKELNVLSQNVEKGEEVFKCYVLNNYENASIMYGGMIQFVSPFFYEYLKTTVLTISINRDHSFYFAPVEYYLSNKLTSKSIKLHLSSSLESFYHENFTKNLKYIDPPNPILHINKNKFLNKLKKLPELKNRLKLGTWDLQKKDDNIDYLPYNMTDETDTECVKPYFISLYQDIEFWDLIEPN